MAQPSARVRPCWVSPAAAVSGRERWMGALSARAMVESSSVVVEERERGEREERERRERGEREE